MGLIRKAASVSTLGTTPLPPRKRMSARKRVLAGTATVLVIGGAGAMLAPATPASADVLINDDSGTIHLGQSLQVGVWYQQFSGGPTGYWAGVWSVPAHEWIFTRSGHASASGWRMWSVKPPKPGEYHTVYNADGTRLTLYTKVK
jgi:hypothetical protein